MSNLIKKPDEDIKFKVQPFIPHYLRLPNKFLRYEQERFVGSHYSATLNIAYFLNKKGKEERCVAQVIWDQDAW